MLFYARWIQLNNKLKSHFSQKKIHISIHLGKGQLYSKGTLQELFLYMSDCIHFY